MNSQLTVSELQPENDIVVLSTDQTGPIVGSVVGVGGVGVTMIGLIAVMVVMVVMVVLQVSCLCCMHDNKKKIVIITIPV